jgi:tRNA threonylcarbamoyladenosine biosynthesis protein TsaB
VKEAGENLANGMGPRRRGQDRKEVAVFAPGRAHGRPRDMTWIPQGACGVHARPRTGRADAIRARVLVLAVDTATAIGSVALVEGSEVRAELAARVSAKHGETLLPNVARVLEEAGVRVEDVGLLAVGIGPGSFTGLRVGLATMKGLALARGTPLVGVSSLRVLARGAGPGPRVVVALLDAHKNEVFAAAFSEDTEGALVERVAPFHAGPADAAARLLAGLADNALPLVLVGDAPAALRAPLEAALVAAGRTLEPAPEGVDFPSAAALAREAEHLYARQGADATGALEPLYVRPPDITLPAR